MSLTDPHYSIPIVVTAIFFLPLVVALFFGRAFCGGVCALGAIQELVVLKPIQVPRRLDQALGLLKYVYLGLAIWFAVQPAVARDFLICRFDPFVGFFRRTGFPHMLMIGGGFLLVGMFVGRPYCRYLCPYGGLLAWCSRLARRGVTITPNKELDCGLCTGCLPVRRHREDAGRAQEVPLLRPLLRLLPPRRGAGAGQDGSGHDFATRIDAMDKARLQPIARACVATAGLVIVVCVAILLADYVVARVLTPRDDKRHRGPPGEGQDRRHARAQAGRRAEGSHRRPAGAEDQRQRRRLRPDRVRGALPLLRLVAVGAAAGASRWR